MTELDALIRRLGLTFTNMGLLQQALTHSSFLNERVRERLELESNERLEFLGDAVVNYVAATILFDRFPAASEGELTALRAALIRTETLAAFARDLDLGRHVRLARGEDSSGARSRPALLADTFEALVAAIALDAGPAAAQAFLAPLFERELAAIADRGLPADFKSALLARVQAERRLTPRYETVAVSGPEHRRAFTVEVLVGDERLGVGEGPSKQAAAQAAARAALERLDA